MPLQSQVVAVLRKYMRDACAFVQPSTALNEIEVDALDLPMVFLDLEDATGVSMTYEDEVEGFATVGDLVDRVALRLQEKRQKAQAPKVVARPKRGWMSAGAERRRVSQ